MSWSGDAGPGDAGTSAGGVVEPEPSDAGATAAEGLSAWDALTAVRAARLHFEQGLSFTSIGGELGLSRFRVARLVATARRAGWVRIAFEAPPGIEMALSEELEQRVRAHGVQRVLVTAEAGGRAALERATAQAVELTARPGDVIGFACGRTVNGAVSAIRRLPASEVVQLTGLTDPGRVADSSVETIRRAARLSGRDVHPVYEPMVQPTAAVARERARHPSLVRAFARWDRLGCALVTVGAWKAGHSNLFDAELLDDAARHRARRAGAVAEICGHLLDADGHPVLPELTARCLSVPWERLREAREVTVIAARPERAAAVRAALRSGIIRTLVTTEAVARALLDIDAADDIDDADAVDGPDDGREDPGTPAHPAPGTPG